MREWVKASTFLVFLGLCFHSKAFLIVPILFLVSFSFSGGGVRFPAGDVAAGGGRRVRFPFSSDLAFR